MTSYKGYLPFWSLRFIPWANFMRLSLLTNMVTFLSLWCSIVQWRLQGQKWVRR